MTNRPELPSERHPTPAPAPPNVQVIEVENMEASGGLNAEHGWLPGVWNNRILNATIHNTIPGASLMGNRVGLPAGTYSVTVTGQPLQAASDGAVGAALRIYDYTHSTLLLSQNTAGYSEASSGRPIAIGLAGTFVLNGAAAVGLDFYINAGAITSYGVSIGSGTPEVYTDAVFTKIG